jgi:hypothetical protein
VVCTGGGEKGLGEVKVSLLVLVLLVAHGNVLLTLFRGGGGGGDRDAGASEEAGMVVGIEVGMVAPCAGPVDTGMFMCIMGTAWTKGETAAAGEKPLGTTPPKGT